MSDYYEDDDDLESGSTDLSSAILSSVGVATSLLASSGQGTVPYTTASVPPIPAPGPSGTMLLLGGLFLLVAGFFVIREL